ncbi:ABC transporter substrate-binding protein [Natrarchaeobius halalkaliphilus]|nr:ABC transporter substrate-binding protein [Natrarchaeobius halalkaliphilus]
MKKVAIGASAGISGITAGCLGDNDDTELQVGIVDPLTEPVSLFGIDEIADTAGENMGAEYELTVNAAEGSPQVINQLSAGELQIGNVAYASFPRSVAQEAVPGGITGIVSEARDAHPDYKPWEILTLEDSDISEPEDLEGSDFGVNAVGTGVHAICELGLREFGLNPDEDIDWVEIEFPAIGSALRDGRIDAGIFVPVFSHAEVAEGGVELVFDSTDVWDEQYDFTFLAARNEFLDDNSDTVEYFLEDYTNLLEYIYDPDNRDDVVSLASDEFDVPEELLDMYYLTEEDFYRPQDGRLDIPRLQEVIDRLYESELIEDNINVEDNATNEYLP